MPDRYQGGMQRIGFPARTSQCSLPEPVKAPRAIGDLHAMMTTTAKGAAKDI
jgi:hypothetical protein